MNANRKPHPESVEGRGFQRCRRALILALLTFPAAAHAASPADLVIWGGSVHTGVGAHPDAEAVAVAGKRIVFVGARTAAGAWVGPKTRVIDLHGAALFPGFTDSHAHLDGIGFRELTLNLEGASSAAEVARRLAPRVAGAKPGAVVVGRGWIETGWPEHRFLNRGDLDPVSPANPVLLTRADGHAVVANSAALKAAGITRDTPAPAGGAILKDMAGEPTGMLVDNAMALVAALRPKPTAGDKREAYRAAFKVEARYGWTGVHFMSAPWEDVGILERMAEAGEAPLRVYPAVDVDQAEPLLASGPRSVADGRITTRAIKMYADGALGSRGAALFEPYADAPGNTGLLRWDKSKAAPVLARALTSGVQVCVHAIGDRANAEVLSSYGAALAAKPAGADPRWRIEHAQNVRPQEQPLFARLGVIASMQPSHAIGDLHFAPDRLGQARLAYAYAWRSLLDAGARLTGGSDAPVERGDPAIEFYAAVARRDLKGGSGPGWHLEQRLTRDEALKLFTAWPAYARFAEGELGTIEIGKRADLTAFDRDLMTAPEDDLPKAHAVLTLVDGAVAFDAHERNGP